MPKELGSAIKKILRQVDPGYKSPSPRKRKGASSSPPNYSSIVSVGEQIRAREESARKRLMSGGTRRKKRSRGTRRR